MESIEPWLPSSIANLNADLCCLLPQVLVYDTSGNCLSSYKAYGDALGVKQVAWAPTGQFLAVGSFDEVTSRVYQGPPLPYSCPLSLT